MAGKVKVRGTDVRAPISDTKSWKNGIAFAIVYEDSAMVPVSTIHFAAGRSGQKENRRSKDEQMAWELML